VLKNLIHGGEKDHSFRARHRAEYLSGRKNLLWSRDGNATGFFLASQAAHVTQGVTRKKGCASAHNLSFGRDEGTANDEKGNLLSWQDEGTPECWGLPGLKCLLVLFGGRKKGNGWGQTRGWTGWGEGAERRPGRKESSLHGPFQEVKEREKTRNMAVMAGCENGKPNSAALKAGKKTIERE